MNIIIKNEETAKNGIIAIGQSLIERAEEIHHINLTKRIMI